MLVIIIIGTIRKGVITFINRVKMVDIQLVLEEINIIIIVITFNGSNFTPLDFVSFFGWLRRV